MFCWKGCLSLLKSFAARSSSCLSQKLALSGIEWEIPNVFMHYLPDEKLRHSHVSDYEPNWLAGIVINHGLDLTTNFRSSFLTWTIRVRLRCSRTFVITTGLDQFFSNSLSSSTACHFQISRGVNCVKMLSSQALPNCLVCCSLDKNWNKQNACEKLTI